MVSNYLPPRVVLLVLGRLVAGGGGGRATSSQPSEPGGGGGRATSSQSSEPGGGKPTPGAFNGGRSLRGDTGVGSTLPSSEPSWDLPSDTEAMERVMSLETASASNDPE
jgi:hypothetical protein